MKRLLAVLLGSALLTFGLPAGVLAVPTITVYPMDQTGWQSAVAAWETEDFSDATLNTGVSVVSDNGTVLGGVWDDQLIPGTAETTWTFDNPIVAFGGKWDLAGPGGPGTGIAVEIDGSWVAVGEIPKEYAGEFWGFVSDEEFTQVLLKAGTDPGGGWAESYELDDMVYAGPMPVGGIVEQVNLSELGATSAQSDHGTGTRTSIALWIGLASGLAIVGGLLALTRRRAS